MVLVVIKIIQTYLDPLFLLGRVTTNREITHINTAVTNEISKISNIGKSNHPAKCMTQKIRKEITKTNEAYPSLRIACIIILIDSIDSLNHRTPGSKIISKMCETNADK